MTEVYRILRTDPGPRELLATADRAQAERALRQLRETYRERRYQLEWEGVEEGDYYGEDRDGGILVRES